MLLANHSDLYNGLIELAFLTGLLFGSAQLVKYLISRPGPVQISATIWPI